MREFPVVLDDSRERLDVTRFAATGAGFISFRSSHRKSSSIGPASVKSCAKRYASAFTRISSRSRNGCVTA